jgi:prophage regulatory protein
MAQQQQSRAQRGRKKLSRTPDPAARVWRLPQVASFTAKSRSQLLRDIDAGRFPRPIRLGEHAVGWLRSEVEAWLNARVAERDQSGAR